MNSERSGQRGERSPAQAASEWLVRHDRGDLSPDEMEAFELWLDGPGNAAAYRKAQRTWSIFDDSDEDQHIRALRRAALDAEQEAQARRRKRIFGMAIAASLALLISAAAFMPYGERAIVAYKDSGNEETASLPEEAESWTYATERGERLNVTLSDGTVVTLNTDTRLEVQYSPEERRVVLERGQAFFEVAHDPDRPFAVAAADRRVVALGTEFDVRLDPGHFQVLLVEGKIAVQRSRTLPMQPDGSLQEIVLEPGQQLSAPLGVDAQVAEVDVDRQLLWREGFVEFDDVVLEAAVAEMNRYSRHPVVIKDQRVAAMRLSGVFRTGQLDRFLEVVGDLLPVTVKRGANQEIELNWSGT